MVEQEVAEREAESRAPAWLTRVVRWFIRSTGQHTWIRITAAVTLLLVVLALTIAVIVATENADLEEPGGAILSYAGLALVSLISCAFPVPGLAPVLYGLIVYQGSALNPLIVAVVSGLSMALGQSTAYLLGAVGVGVAERRVADADRPKAGRLQSGLDWLSGNVEPWMARRGFITLVVLAAIPNPVILFANASAGATGMPFPKFYAAMAIGMTIRAGIFAGLGAWIGTAA